MIFEIAMQTVRLGFLTLVTDFRTLGIHLASRYKMKSWMSNCLSDFEFSQPMVGDLKLVDMTFPQKNTGVSN